RLSRFATLFKPEALTAATGRLQAPPGRGIVTDIHTTHLPEETIMPAVPLSQVAVHLRPEDNVAIAARRLEPGLELQHNGTSVTLAGRIGLGHKVALRPIKKGEAVYKYGQIIGFASKDIAPGEHVHVHNVAADAFERDYAFCRDCPLPPTRPAEQ